MYRIAIGIDLDWPLAHHYDIIRGIQDYANEHKLECSVEPWLEFSESFEGYQNDFDGIIARVTPAIHNYCKNNSIPLVNVWENSPITELPSVKRNFKTMTHMMVSYFANRGFHNIKFMKRSKDTGGAEMAKLFIDEMTKLNLDVNEESMINGFSPVTVEEWLDFNEILSNWIGKQKFPIALCTSDYFLARYVVEWCKKAKILVPDDIAIISASSNEFICEHLEPSISYLKSSCIEWGYEAAKTIHKILDGKKYSKVTEVAPAKLVEKDSTNVTPVEDRIIANALRFIRDNTSSPIQVADVATAVDISRRSLERRFRQQMDRSINEEILRSKMETASKLLLNSDKTISEIAKLTGISSGQRLSQVFRKHMGLSITDYRKNNSGNQ